MWVHSVVIKIKKNTNGETKFKVRCSKVIVRLECVSFVVPLHDGGEGDSVKADKLAKSLPVSRCLCCRVMCRREED